VAGVLSRPHSGDRWTDVATASRPEHVFAIVVLARYASQVMRHTTFRFALDPTPAQEAKLARHAGASRFAYNQCLDLVSKALNAKQVDPLVRGAVV
jgi:hypothetical protein